jgi:indolepyruvate ferredoxin oxidoreductase beta subunit
LRRGEVVTASPTTVLVAGAAGQGAEEGGALLAAAAAAAGHQVRLATERPPSPAAGSVLCRVRFGPGAVPTPFGPPGEADGLLALDRLEALRWIHEVRAGGFALVAAATLPTPAMRLGIAAAPPPADVLARLRARVPRTAEVDALGLAREIGCPLYGGSVLLGLAGPLLGIPEPALDAAAAAVEPAEAAPARRLALALGQSLLAGLPEALRRVPGPRAA